MPQEYTKIYGYFDFEKIYSLAMEKFPKDATFLEIGVWLGKSACYMGELLKEQNSNNKFYCLDHFFGEINATDQQNIIKENQGSVYNLFLKNMEPVKGFYTPIKDFSQNAAYKFKNETFDFIFLDAEHSYGCVLNDLNTWYPKLKKTGIFAGHDYRGEVQQAVDEFFGKLSKPVQKIDNSFIVL